MATYELTSDDVSEKLGKWLSTSVSKNVKLLEDSSCIEDFSSWVSEEVASKTKNAKYQSVIYMITNFAILETAQHVFNIGSGFTKADMTGFTLKQILETVQKIDENVDKMLKEPLNSAIKYFRIAVTEIESENFKDAYNSF